MTANTTFDENAGINKLANVLIERMKKENESPLCLDFGEIQANGSLITNTFPVSIPKGQYCVCRQLTLGTVEDELVKTEDDGSHQHNEDNSGDDLHKENVFEENIETEHEKMFSEEGIKIKALIAKFNIR